MHTTVNRINYLFSLIILFYILFLTFELLQKSFDEAKKKPYLLNRTILALAFRGIETLQYHSDLFGLQAL